MQYEIWRTGKLISNNKADLGPLSLPTGQYTIIGKSGLLEEIHEVTIEAEKQQTLNLAFPRGHLKVSAFPLDCKFTLRRVRDGKILINTPLPNDSSELSEGRYEAVISANGESVTRSVSIAQGIETSLDEKLPVGDLVLDAPGASSNARYEIRRGGVIENSGTLPTKLHNYRAGDFQIVAEDGLARQTQAVNLSAASTATSVFNFRYGKLEIDTTPSGAQFNITSRGGVVTSGVTPFASSRFPTGVYNVTLRMGEITQSRELKIEEDLPTVVSCLFPVGNLTVTGGPANAEYFILSDGQSEDHVFRSTTKILREGKYTAEARYNGIVSEKTFTITAGQMTALDFSEKTGSLMVSMNRPGTSVVLRPVSGKAFALERTAPVLIENLPFGDYTVEYGGETSRVSLERTDEEIRLVFSRKIEEVIPERFLSELDTDGMHIYDSANGAAAARVIPRDVRVVWKTVFSRASMGILRQQPYVFDQQAGWMIGVSFELKSRVAGKRVNCRQIAVLTDLGAEGVEVKVFSQTFLTWGEMAMDRNTGQYVAQPHSQSLYDGERNMGLSNAFLDDIERNLGIRKAVQRASVVHPSSPEASLDSEQANAERSAADQFETLVASVLAQRREAAGNGPVLVFDTKSWRARTSPTAAKDAARQAADICRHKWRILSESQTAPHVMELQLGLKGLMAGNRYHLLIQISGLPNQDLDIRTNLVMSIVQDINDPPNFRDQMQRAGNDLFREYTECLGKEIAKIVPL